MIVIYRKDLQSSVFRVGRLPYMSLIPSLRYHLVVQDYRKLEVPLPLDLDSIKIINDNDQYMYSETCLMGPSFIKTTSL